MPILGLMTTEQFSSDRFKNIRRSVFYFYPNGTAPLLGLLSLMKEEVTNDPEFKWYEKRLVQQTTTAANISTTIAFYKTVDATWATWTIADGNITFATTTQYGVKVAAGGTAQFRVGHIFKMNVIDTNAASQELQGRITYVDATNDRLAFLPVRVPTVAVDYDSASNAGAEILVIGNAFAEGALSQSGTAGTSTLNVYNAPINPSNYTQIFRTPYQITGTALKTSAKFDEDGIFPDMAKDAAVNHMRELEFAFLFGNSLQYTSGSTVLRNTGGVLYFLRLWEAADSIYRGGTGAAAITADTSDDKRIIVNASGSMSLNQYDGYLERIFRNVKNKNNEILALCGSGYLLNMNKAYEGKAVLESSIPMTETYGMNVVGHQTPFGKIWYKTHPLFSLNPTMRFNAVYLDVGNLKYRPLAGRDTELLRDRQPNNADYIEHEYLTEAGLEVDAPEAHMYIQNFATVGV